MKDEVTLLEYNDVTVESRGFMVPVRLKLSDQGVAFRNVKTGKLEQIATSDIEVVNWQRLAGSHGIRIFTSNGNLFRFGGFKENEQSKLENFFKTTCKKTMSIKEFSVKGWNYGSSKFDGGVLSFDVSSVPAFEIPINNVSGCLTGKNEVTLEFHQHDDAAVSLMEMRLHIPTSELAGDDPVENFQEKILDRASIITATGDAFAIFSQVHCLTPRGRYEMKMFPTFIQLHGKSFDFKILTDTVLRLFLLPHIDQRQHFFVVSLDPPIKQGLTRYPYLIILFQNDEMNDIELALTEEELQEKYENRLEPSYSGPQFEIISRLCKGLCNRKIVTPGNFIGHSRTPAISCSYKAAAGYLYPLERGFIYVHKPPIHIRFDEISSIYFARSGSTTRSFDFEVECRNGVVNTFSSIEKGEYHKLYDFVIEKKLRIKNTNKMNPIGKRTDAFSDSDADEPDHYLSRVRQEAKERMYEDGGGDEDEESEDSDFNPDKEGGSDVAEEFDSNASSSDSDASGGGGGSGSDGSPKRKKPKEVKPKKSRTVSEKPRKKREKKEKDANKPKRPMSAYFLWLNETRSQIQKDNPGISITEVSKKAGAMWRELKDKTKWEKQASEAKKSYEVAMKDYKATGGGEGPTSKKSPKKKSSKTSKPSSPTISPTKAGSGAGFKSKEYIDEDSSSSQDSDNEPLSKSKTNKKPALENKTTENTSLKPALRTKGTKKPPPKGKKPKASKKESEDESMEEDGVTSEEGDDEDSD